MCWYLKKCKTVFANRGNFIVYWKLYKNKIFSTAPLITRKFKPSTNSVECERFQPSVLKLGHPRTTLWTGTLLSNWKTGSTRPRCWPRFSICTFSGSRVWSFWEFSPEACFFQLHFRTLSSSALFARCDIWLRDSFWNSWYYN